MTSKDDMLARLRADIASIEWSTADIERPERDKTSDQAFQKILRSASVREQSSLRMRQKLTQAGFEEAAITEAIDRACRLNVINDVRYSDMLIRTTIAQGKGLRFALEEVERLGVDPSSLDSYCDYLENASDEDEARALRILELHPPRAKNKREAAYRKLIAKGYTSDVAASVARRWSESTE